ncbi:MAG: family N-acetyltransferase, partial [Chthonomonadales bacterium]|nr:family N-acetyltransferase [Chthonomonadales bacterium]
FQRELVVAPDEVRWHGRYVFPYHFQDGDAYLKLTFDSVSENLTALETPEYSVACWLEAEECAAGETFPFTWEIRNRTGKPLEVVILTETDPGLELKLQERLVVTETTTLTRSLRIVPDARPPRDGEKHAAVRSTVLVNGQPISLEAGVKVVRPVEITFDGCRLLPGAPQRITVKLRNRLERELTGTLALDPHPTLLCDTPMQAFTLPAQAWTQCEFTVAATTSGILPSQLRLTAGETQLNRPVVFRAFRSAEPQAFVEPKETEKAVLETPNLHLAIWLRGGRCSLFYGGALEGLVMHPMAELGPPFASWRECPLVLENRIESAGEYGLSLVQSVSLPEYPGLIVERTLSLFAEDVVRVAYRVINISDLPQPAQIRLSSHGSLNGTIVIPTPQGIIREPQSGHGGYPQGERDALPPGLPLAEDWIACESEGKVTGLLWEGSPTRDMHWTGLMNFNYDLGELPPHSDIAVPAIYLVGGRGDWKTVRNWWKRLHRAMDAPETVPPQTIRVLEAAFTPSPALLTGPEGKAQITLANRRGKTLSGTMTLTGIGFQPEPAAFTLTEIDRDNPFAADVQLTGPTEPTAENLRASIDSGPTTRKFDLPVIQMGSGDTLRVSNAEDGLFVIENGLLTMRVAPQYRGAMTSLECNGVEHLFSAYPTPRPFVWWNLWHGGVYPSLGFGDDDDALRTGTFTGEAMTRIGERGLEWQGVRVAGKITHKDWNWLGLEVEYLTLAGSNLVAIVTRWTNRSPARMTAGTTVMAWLQPGAARENVVAHWSHDGERLSRRRGGFQEHHQSGSWAAVENPVTGDTLALITSVPDKQIQVGDMAEEGVHLQALQGHTFAPHETKEMLTWLVLTSGLTSLEAYASLAKVERLP